MLLNFCSLESPIPAAITGKIDKNTLERHK